jgi:hypothetical protein
MKAIMRTKLSLGFAELVTFHMKLSFFETKDSSFLESFLVINTSAFRGRRILESAVGFAALGKSPI